MGPAVVVNIETVSGYNLVFRINIQWKTWFHPHAAAKWCPLGEAVYSGAPSRCYRPPSRLPGGNLFHNAQARRSAMLPPSQNCLRVHHNSITAKIHTSITSYRYRSRTLYNEWLVCKQNTLGHFCKVLVFYFQAALGMNKVLKWSKNSTSSFLGSSIPYHF